MRKISLCLMVAFLGAIFFGCAPRNTLYLQGSVASEKSVQVEYRKSLEQENLEKSVQTTKNLAAFPVRFAGEALKIPLGLAVFVLDGAWRSIRKLSKEGEQKR